MGTCQSREASCGETVQKGGQRGRLGSGESQGQGCEGDGAPAADASESSNFSALLKIGPCHEQKM